jgi:hypothetical protein
METDDGWPKIWVGAACHTSPEFPPRPLAYFEWTSIPRPSESTPLVIRSMIASSCGCSKEHGFSCHLSRVWKQ